MKKLILNDILKAHKLSITKRLEKFDYFEIKITEQGKDSYHVKEMFLSSGDKEPKIEQYFLNQYDDIIFQSLNIDTMIQYILNNFNV
ncbi:MAG: hypothetical protein Q4A77_09440 [Leptotrichia hongkongensis]|nr:hypothetical protein [Leptotrichia hongkongensis]